VSLAGSTVGGLLVPTVTGSGTTYTVTVTGMAGTGTVVANVPAGAALDPVGNPSLAATATNNTVTFDGVAPTATIDQAAGQGDPMNAPAVTFTVAFSEPVTGFTASDVSFAGSTVGGLLSASVSGVGANYTVTVTGMTGTGTVVAGIPAGAAADAAGNVSGASTSADNTVNFDGVAPTVTLNQAAGQTDPAIAGPILFTVVFSEPVTGFTGSDVSFAGSTVGGTPLATVSGGGTTYSVSVTGMTGIGNVVARVNADAATDAAGNGNTASTGIDNVVAFDGVVPTVTIDQAAGQADPTNAASVAFTVVFSKPVTGFTASDVSFAGSTVGGTLAAAVTGSGTTYNVTVTGMAGEGTVVASIPAGAATDSAGHPSAASTSTDNSITYDNQATTAVVTQAAGQADPTAGAPVRFTVTFSEPVTGFTASDVGLAGSTAGGTLVAAVAGSGTTYTVTVTGMTSPGDVVVSVPAGAAADGFGNANLASAGGDPRVAYAGSVFAVGAGGGGSPRLDVYDGAGQLRFSNTVFAPGFRGGVVVATADVTGDGVPDGVVGTGPGAVTRVQVIDGVTHQPVASYQPFESSFTGGVFVAAGDVTGDGVPDVLITPDLGGGPRVVVLRGGDFAPIASFFGIDDPDFRGGARAAAGDMNGDGIDDVAVAAGFLGGPRVSAFDGATITSGRPVHLFSDIFIFDGPDVATLRNGAFVAIADLDADGFGDLVGGGGPGGGPRVYALSGRDLTTGAPGLARPVANFFAGNPDNRGGVRVAGRDLNGDGRPDLVVGDGEGAGSLVTAYLGGKFVNGRAPAALGFDAYPGFVGGVFVG
jgi:hypothetical protein